VSIMQTFRDGYRIKFHISLGRLLNQIAAVCLIVFMTIFYYHGQYDRATFDAVLVLWCLHWERGYVNGTPSHD
jgi:hypothetical protein